MLRDSAIRLCRDLGGPKRARQLRTDGVHADRDAWREIARAGWLSTAVAESSGGMGMGQFDLSLVMEEAGRQLLMVPLVEAAASTWALAVAGVAKLGDVLEGKALIVPALPQPTWGVAHETGGRPGNGRDTGAGQIRFVPFAPEADAFLVSTPDGLALLAKGDVSVKTVANVDGSSSSDITSKTRGEVVAKGADAARLVAGMRELLALGTAAQLLGVSQAAFDMTLEYIKFRQQFAKPLGSFQALQHRAADCFVDVELNRSLVYRVFSAWDAGQCHPAMVSAAKARTSRSALAITRTALQLHGAIGYTDEHDIGLYYKRAVALAALYGNDVNHTTEFSRLTVDAQ
jgi:alkylation response protein AidB-like acyl-CoA dehydrogenase